MSKAERLFEVIQILRNQKKSISGQEIADILEVSLRTVYRDIQTLQAMRTPIDGEAGVGYIMRQGYDLPPINFTSNEIDAITVGLNLLSRTGDKGLLLAAKGVANKIGLAQGKQDSLQTSDWGVDTPILVSAESLRECVQDQRKVCIHYRDDSGEMTERVIKPIVVMYYIKVIVLVAWCELRHAFRHFRLDRILLANPLDEYFKNEGESLRNRWKAL